MGYQVTGSLWHEIVGIIKFVLFAVHLVLNGYWFRNFKSIAKKYFTSVRSCLMFLTDVGLMIDMIVLAEYILESINNLEQSGAEIVALTAGTMHVVYDLIKDKVHVPFISIPTTVAEYAETKKYKKVGLLGTIFTMEKSLE